MLKRLFPTKPTPLQPGSSRSAIDDYMDELRQTPLVQLAGNDDDWLRVGDALEGVQIFGATGSGKTSGSGRTLALSFLEQGWGGLVLTAKRGDAKDWRKWAADSGRAADLIDLRPGGDWQFNFLGYELAHPPPDSTSTHDVVSLFLNAMGPSGERATNNDAFWEDALRQLLTNAFDLANLAGEVSTEAMASIVRSAPQRLEETTSPDWQDPSECWRLLKLADSRRLEGPRSRDFDETVDYWTQEFPSLSDRTRSVVVSSFMSKATGLLRSPLRELFGQGPSKQQALPELSRDGRIIIVNLPVKLYGETGRFAQRIVKIVWQRAMERQEAEVGTRPVFLWADESQYFVTPEDGLFQQTARSALVATVYLTQNLSNYIAALGGRDARAQAESLLGNLQTKVFHANGDPTTNEWAEKLIGHDFEMRRSKSYSAGGSANAAGQPDSPRFSMGHNPTYAPVVLAREFTTLRKGGGPNGRTEAIVFEGGRTWRDTGENYLRTAFDQGTRTTG